MKDVINVRFLGQCLPRNPGGIACYAYIIRNKEGLLLEESCGLAAELNSPSATSSVATYTALIRALEWLINNRYKKDIIKVYGSSKPVISQINEAEATSIDDKNNNMPKSILPLFKRVMKLKSKFYYISFELNQGDNNGHMNDKEIEELSILAYTEAKTKILNHRGSGFNNDIDKTKQDYATKLFSTAAELMMNAAAKNN
jgi:ribonuclease HI